MTAYKWNLTSVRSGNDILRPTALPTERGDIFGGEHEFDNGIAGHKRGDSRARWTDGAIDTLDMGFIWG